VYQAPEPKPEPVPEPAPRPSVLPPIQPPATGPQLLQYRGTSPPPITQLNNPLIPNNVTTGTPNQQLNALEQQRRLGNIAGTAFNNQLLRIATEAGVARRIAANASDSATTAPFTVTAHRYWDSETGQYSNVSEIALEDIEKGDPIEKINNPQGYTTLQLTKDDASLDGTLRVAVTWDNGRSRTWDYSNRDPNGGSADVFSPAG